MDIGKQKVNAEAIEQGEWIENIPEAGDLRLKLRGRTCADYRQMQQRLISALPRNVRFQSPLPLETSDRINLTCLVEVCMIDWEGVLDNGQPVKFSKELALQIMKDPAQIDFQEAVYRALEMVGRGEKAANEAIAKN